MYLLIIVSFKNKRKLQLSVLLFFYSPGRHLLDLISQRGETLVDKTSFTSPHLLLMCLCQARTVSGHVLGISTISTIVPTVWCGGFYHLFLAFLKAIV